MVLNRYAPEQPQDLVGGRNPLWGPSFAEFEWAPNPERDVLGYRVYRLAGGPVRDDQSLLDDVRRHPTACGRDGRAGRPRLLRPRGRPGAHRAARSRALTSAVVTVAPPSP